MRDNPTVVLVGIIFPSVYFGPLKAHSQQEYAPVLHLRFLRIINNAIKLRIPITPAETKRMAGDSTPNGQTHLLCPTSG